METIQNSKIVTEQYKDARNLKTRISIHDKYSVNKQGFGNWIFEQYNFNKNNKVLELGCGNGAMWRCNYQKLPHDIHLILTDFSEGMLTEAKNNIPKSNAISFQQIDIQNILFPDHSFDIVIANMMLYHVPDLDKGLSEVRRILKKDGTFYCATYGEHGIIEYIQDMLTDYSVQKSMNKVFTLQNGEKILKHHFSSIEKRIYKDHLEVTNTEDLVDYVLSLTSMVNLNGVSKYELSKILESKKIDGKIHIPKEYGMFIVK